ncbi:MAG: glycosyltransferase family 2 protein [Coriobacteriia bacterium]
MNVVALIPAFNEAERIAATVTAVRAIGGVSRVLVIDDGSSDATVHTARQAGAEVIELGANRGKGAALDAGYASVADTAEILMLLDGDLGESASQASRLLEPVLSSEADMTIATFPRPSGKAGFGLVMGLARAGIRTLGGDFDAHAPLSGQRVLSARAARICAPFAFGYGVEVALTIRALRAGLLIVEIPTTMTHAATGRDVTGFVHRGRQFAHVLGALLRLAIEPRPKTS